MTYNNGTKHAAPGTHRCCTNANSNENVKWKISENECFQNSLNRYVHTTQINTFKT
jgi:hypothetical protein